MTSIFSLNNNNAADLFSSYLHCIVHSMSFTFSEHKTLKPIQNVHNTDQNISASNQLETQ